MESESDSNHDENVKQILKEVYSALEKRGYNALSQITGYLISDDLGYISNYKEARNKISKLDRSNIIEILLKEYLK